MLEIYRKSDAVVIVRQNNARRLIEVMAMNAEAEELTGHASGALAGLPLAEILPPRLKAIIADFIEYEDAGNDLLAVLGKVRNFALLLPDGTEKEFGLRIIRGESVDRNAWFHLIVENDRKTRERGAFRKLLKENFKGHEVLDEHTGLANRLSILKDIELALHSVRSNNISASFAILDINHYDRLKSQIGEGGIHQLHRHIGGICKTKLRQEDTICTLSERSLGLLLVDASQESTRQVLNRLRWAIGTSPLKLGREDFIAHVNIGFTPLGGRIGETDILEKCEEYMTQLRARASNAIQLIILDNRRAQDSDRRRQHVPVAVDRRQGDRRKGE